MLTIYFRILVLPILLGVTASRLELSILLRARARTVGGRARAEALGKPAYFCFIFTFGIWFEFQNETNRHLYYYTNMTNMVWNNISHAKLQPENLQEFTAEIPQRLSPIKSNSLRSSHLTVSWHRKCLSYTAIACFWCYVNLWRHLASFVSVCKSSSTRLVCKHRRDGVDSLIWICSVHLFASRRVKYTARWRLTDQIQKVYTISYQEKC